MKRENNKILGSAEINELLVEFCHAICAVKEPEEAAHFLKDLLSRKEIMMLAKRLRIARMLIENKKYETIQNELSVGTVTIARVNAWLQESGEGYRLVVERTKKRPIEDVEIRAMREVASPWRQMQRRHPLYFWPQLLLREIVEGAPQRQRKKLLRTLAIVKKAGHKDKLFRDLTLLLHKGKGDM